MEDLSQLHDRWVMYVTKLIVAYNNQVNVLLVNVQDLICVVTCGWER